MRAVCLVNFAISKNLARNQAWCPAAFARGASERSGAASVGDGPLTFPFFKKHRTRTVFSFNIADNNAVDYVTRAGKAAFRYSNVDGSRVTSPIRFRIEAVLFCRCRVPLYQTFGDMRRDRRFYCILCVLLFLYHKNTVYTFSHRRSVLAAILTWGLLVAVVVQKTKPLSIQAGIYAYFYV